MTPQKQTLPKDHIEARIFSLQAVLAEYDSLMFSLLNERRWEAYREKNPHAVEVMIGIIRERHHEIDEEINTLLDRYSDLKKRKE